MSKIQINRNRRGRDKEKVEWRHLDGMESEMPSYSLRFSFQFRIEEPQQETGEICTFFDFTEERSYHAVLAIFLNTEFT